MSLIAVGIEAWGLWLLLRADVPVMSSVGVMGSLGLQTVLAVLCVVFGVLWTRSLARVRASIAEREEVRDAEWCDGMIDGAVFALFEGLADPCQCRECESVSASATMMLM